VQARLCGATTLIFYDRVRTQLRGQSLRRDGSVEGHQGLRHQQ